MKTKTHGWILQEANGGFVDVDGTDVINLKDAFVFKTRAVARSEDGNGDMSKLDTDVVRKVETNKSGKAVKIISGR